MRLKVLTQKYPCNGCTVCCTVMAVEPLGKPFYARCVNELKDGCGIYEDRPQECRDFICSFAAGLMGDATTWRPDQCGLLFFLRRFSDGLWLEIFEAVAGAAADARRLDYLVGRIIAKVEKTEKVVGTRLHHQGDQVGLGFVADETNYPGGAETSRKMNRYAWINGDKTRQVFQECHD